MTENPITKKITRHVSGYWRGHVPTYSTHPPVWTVGLLQQIVDDVRAAGYSDYTQLRPEIGADRNLNAFRLTITESLAEEMVHP